MRADTGASMFLPPLEMYRRARRVSELAVIVMDCTATAGDRRDLRRAAALLAEIGAIVGDPPMATEADSRRD